MPAERDVATELREDFRKFLWAGWLHLNLPVPAPVQLDIAMFLQHGSDRVIIEAFRGVGKSWITAMYVCWQLYRDPNIKILIASATKDHAAEMTTFILQIIDTWDVMAEWRTTGASRRSKMSFDVGHPDNRPAKAPSVLALGIMGQLQGPRADLIIADDVEAKGNTETPHKRSKLKSNTAEFSSIITPGGKIVYLGTPQTSESLYNKLDSSGIYTTRIWTAEGVEKSRFEWDSRLAPFMQQFSPGQPVWEDRFDKKTLYEREAEYGRSGYRLQFMLDTRLADEDAFPLKLKDVVILPLDIVNGPSQTIWGPVRGNELADVPNLGRDTDALHGPAPGSAPSYRKWDDSILCIDPSGRGKDETVGMVLKMSNGQIYAADIFVARDGYSEETITALAQMAKKHKTSRVVYESNFGDGMFETIAEPIFNKVYRQTFEGIRSTVQKEKRIISTLEPVMNQHRLIFDQQLIHRDHELIQGYAQTTQLSYSLVFQMTRLRDEKDCLDHDDRLDCLALGVAHLQEMLSLDAEKETIAQKEDEIEQWIARAEAQAFGHSFDDEDSLANHSLDVGDWSL